MPTLTTGSGRRRKASSRTAGAACSQVIIENNNVNRDILVVVLFLRGGFQQVNMFYFHFSLADAFNNKHKTANKLYYRTMNCSIILMLIDR